MLKIIPLLIKVAPIVWAFIKEVVLKKEDKRYFIRNKLQLFVTLLIILYILTAYILFEGYNAHAAASKRKSAEIQELYSVLDRKIQENTDLHLSQCPTDFKEFNLQKVLDEKTLNEIRKNNGLVLDQK